MKKTWAFAAFLAGVIVLWWAFPRFSPVAPHGLSISRAEARRLADPAAKGVGIPVEKSWAVVTWEETPVLEKDLRDSPVKRLAAEKDPLMGTRLDYFRITYFREDLEKRPEFGYVLVSKDGRVMSARRLARPEETGAKPDAAQLRPIADRFINRDLPGAPSPQFDSVRPVVMNSRVDHVFRYRVKSSMLLDQVALLANVYFIGDQLAGWVLIEEYADGRLPRFEAESELIATFGRYIVTFGLLFLLLAIFLRKYHAGEVGVKTPSYLFAFIVVLSIILTWLIASEEALQTGFGGITAKMTATTWGAFKFLFYDLPLGLLIFLAWSVGESFVRERWGDRLASYDSLLRRDVFNATVGESLLFGFLGGPLIAAAGLLPAAIGISNGTLSLNQSPLTNTTLGSSGGSWTVIVSAMIDATAVCVVSLLFILGSFHRFMLSGSRVRQLSMAAAGFVVAALVGSVFNPLPTPVQPELQRMLFGAGAVMTAAVIFYLTDLLAAATALYTAILIAAFVPLIMATSGSTRAPFTAALVIPLAVTLALALAGMMTRRRIEYQKMGLAPHVTRIIERERVKAEIDAANRIQAALLPEEAPEVSGASFASHYRSATEIGGDYFDFLQLPGDRIGIAFGDVAGHGLTSGIVMAMAKSALLVQVEYDSSPAEVLKTLNEIVRKTAPKRMLMTFFFGVLDPSTHELVFSSAGHLDPYVYRKATGRLESLSSWGFPLGVRRPDPFPVLTVTFEAGDRLILYSDGLIEALDDNGEPFGFDRFEQVLQQNGKLGADDIKKSILNAVKKFTHNRPPEDDQTLVVVSFEHLTSARMSA